MSLHSTPYLHIGLTISVNLNLHYFFKGCFPENENAVINGFYAQLHYFLKLSQCLVSCLPLAKLINSGVSDYCCRDY